MSKQAKTTRAAGLEGPAPLRRVSQLIRAHQMVAEYAEQNMREATAYWAARAIELSTQIVIEERGNDEQS